MEVRLVPREWIGVFTTPAAVQPTPTTIKPIQSVNRRPCQRCRGSNRNGRTAAMTITPPTGKPRLAFNKPMDRALVKSTTVAKHRILGLGLSLGLTNSLNTGFVNA